MNKQQQDVALKALDKVHLQVEQLQRTIVDKNQTIADMQQELDKAEGKGMAFVLNALLRDRELLPALQVSNVYFKVVTHPELKNFLMANNSDMQEVRDAVNKYLALPIAVAEMNTNMADTNVRLSKALRAALAYLTMEQIVNVMGQA